MARDPTTIATKFLPSEARSSGVVAIEDAVFVMGPDGYLTRLYGDADGNLRAAPGETSTLVAFNQDQLTMLTAIAYGIARINSLGLDDLLDAAQEWIANQ